MEDIIGYSNNKDFYDIFYQNLLFIIIRKHMESLFKVALVVAKKKQILTVPLEENHSQERDNARQKDKQL